MEWMCAFTFALDDIRQFGVGCKISHHIVGLTASVSLSEEIQTAIDHALRHIAPAPRQFQAAKVTCVPTIAISPNVCSRKPNFWK
jgi:hypothetical protein